MTEERLQKILEETDLPDVGKIDSNGLYVIQLDNSDDYAYYFTLLDNNINVEVENSSSISSTYLNQVVFEGYGYKIYLNANFETDNYTVKIEDTDEL